MRGVGDCLLAKLEERMPAHVDQVWTEVLAVQEAVQVNADRLTGMQVFGAGTNDAYT